jgi:hypothetical protein
MKLIVAGATGFVGTEVVRQALHNPAVTSVVALARKPLLPPTNAGPSADTSKLQAIVLEDWTSPYPGFVSEHIKGADACIWSVNPELNFVARSLMRSHIGPWQSRRPNPERWTLQKLPRSALTTPSMALKT